MHLSKQVKRLVDQTLTLIIATLYQHVEKFVCPRFIANSFGLIMPEL